MISTLQTSAYGWLMLAGILVSLVFWSRLARRDERLLIIYIAALAGAFFGAKIVYFLSEGWMHWQDPDRWVVLATGKSITGALLGGYAAVEIIKHHLGYRHPTGDWFAMIVPFGIILGRIGCILHGCCLGRVCKPSWFTMADDAGAARWPAALAELMFNALILAVLLRLRGRRGWNFQLFHVYLICYGFFRFWHEFLRDTPRLVFGISGYQLAALAVCALGVWGFLNRRLSESGLRS